MSILNSMVQMSKEFSIPCYIFEPIYVATWFAVPGSPLGVSLFYICAYMWEAYAYCAGI